MKTYCSIGLGNLIHERFYINYTINVTNLIYVEVVSDQIIESKQNWWYRVQCQNLAVPSLLEVQHLRPHLRPSESGFAFNKIAGSFVCTWIFNRHCSWGHRLGWFLCQASFYLVLQLKGRYNSREPWGEQGGECYLRSHESGSSRK